MSTYPGAIDSFPTWQDGVDTVTASMPNNIQSSVIAVESTLGVNPQGSFATVGAAVAAKVSKAGDTLSGDLDMAGNSIKNLAGPGEDLDAANKQYVRSEVNPDGIRWRDDFLADKSALWTLSGTGGTYTQNAELGGTGALSTGATSGNQAILSYNGKGVTDSSKDPNLVTRGKISSTTQIRAVLAGLYKDANNLIEIYYDVTSTAGNFKYRCVSGGTESSVDSGVAADTSYHWFEIEGDDAEGEVRFRIDDANEQAIGSNIPTDLLEPRIMVETKEAADKVLTIDLVNLEAGR